MTLYLAKKPVKALYLANNMDALNRLAANNGVFPAKHTNALIKVALKLFGKSQLEANDEEATYILLSRFIRIYDRLLETHPDQVFLNAMLGKEATIASQKLVYLRTSLTKRYEEATKMEIEDKFVTTADPILPMIQGRKSSVFNNELFISCVDLYNVHRNEDVNVLVMDVRCEADFEESHIAGVSCINIPGRCIQAGLSAHRLGGLLPSSSKQQWTKRDSFDAVVLVDWDTAKIDNFSSTKVDKLRSILVDWDVGRTYNEKPVVLKDGYREWLEMYPTLCSSSDSIYARANWELDEMLELEIVQYPPSTSDQSLTLFDQEPSKGTPFSSDPAGPSRDDLLEEEFKVIAQNKEITTQLLKKEEQWKEIHEKITEEYDMIKLHELKKQEQETEETIEKLSEQEAELLEKKSQLANDFNLATSFLPSDLAPRQRTVKLEDINKLAQEHMDMLSARQAFAVHRQLLLDEARQSKKPILPIPCEPEEPIEKTTRPKINRKTKPKAVHLPTVVGHMEGKVQSVEYGATGLGNSRNICYMNTIIQCLRHIPDLILFYCNGEYVKHLHKSPPRISNEMAHLVRALWSNTYSVIRPKEFYNKFTSHAPVYKQGYHEDCLEFFLQLFSYLSDDCAVNVAANNNWSETRMSWYKQHCGKSSYFINMFYHQLRIQHACLNCKTTNMKFDIENIFYLTVPDKTFKLEASMSDYMKCQDQIICKTCKSPKVLKKSLTYYPSILIVALKRHIQDYTQDTVVHYRKNLHECYFPVDDFKVGTSSYTLKAIALHQGNLTSGHYTAICRNPINGRWYLFNDESVNEDDITRPLWRTRAYAFFYTLKKTSGSRDVLPPEVFEKTIEPDSSSME